MLLLIQGLLSRRFTVGERLLLLLLRNHSRSVLALRLLLFRLGVLLRLVGPLLFGGDLLVQYARDQFFIIDIQRGFGFGINRRTACNNHLAGVKMIGDDNP